MAHVRLVSCSREVCEGLESVRRVAAWTAWPPCAWVCVHYAVRFCEALLGWVLIAAAVAGRAFGLIWTEDPPPPFCVLAGAVGPHCLVFGSVVGWMLAALHSCYVLLVDL